MRPLFSPRIGIFSAIILNILLGSAPTAHAHLNSVSYSMIDITDKEVRIELRYTLLCTLELFPADRDGDFSLSDEELKDLKPMMFYYLNNKIKVLSGGLQLKMEIKHLRFSVEEDDSFVIADLSFPAKEAAIESVIILCNLSEEADIYHRNLSQIKMKGEEYLFVFTNSNYFNSLHPPKSQSAKSASIPSSATEK